MSATATMATSNHFSERAQQQFNQLHADAKRILQTVLTEEPEHIEWDMETIFSKRKKPEKSELQYEIKMIHNDRTK